MIPSDRLYRTKVDRAVVLAFVATVVGSLLVILVIPASAGNTRNITFWMVLVVWLLCCPVLGPVKYLITDNKLTIRVGVLRWHIPLSCIVSVIPNSAVTKRPIMITKAAYSTDTLLIHVAKDAKDTYFSVSPEDRDGFMHELHLREPGLAYDGEQLHHKAEESK
jgi:hypothetical protein